MLGCKTPTAASAAPIRIKAKNASPTCVRTVDGKRSVLVCAAGAVVSIMVLSSLYKRKLCEHIAAAKPSGTS
jgi:hypothetical protein